MADADASGDAGSAVDAPDGTGDADSAGVDADASRDGNAAAACNGD